MKAGLAEARAGQQAGYRLRRPPDQITLLEIVEAAEGPLRPERCTLHGGPCHWDDVCPLHMIWEEGRGALTKVLSERTLTSIVAVDAALEAGAMAPPEDAHRGQNVKARQGR